MESNRFNFENTTVKLKLFWGKNGFSNIKDLNDKKVDLQHKWRELTVNFKNMLLVKNENFNFVHSLVINVLIFQLVSQVIFQRCLFLTC